MSRYQNGTYYVGRVIKLGILDTEKLIDAILRPSPLRAWGNAWTFINATKTKSDKGEFVYAKLCKYSPDAEVVIVDPAQSKELKQNEPNLSIASSPFVYIPEFSGIAFLRVSNHIEPKTFMNKFCKVIENKYHNFFVECAIEPIADIRSFAIKLSKLKGIYSISANISPPNPLFGPLWENLKTYLEERRTDKMKILEESYEDHTLNTNLPALVQGVADQTPEHPFEAQKVDIGDAAVLMAADGYGAGYVKGRMENEIVTIKTSDTIKNFSFSKDPKPEALFNKAYDILKKIKDDRHMKHDI